MATATVTRPVLSEDPSLSEEANRLLTQELRNVIGRDSVEVPADWPDHHADRHARHSSIVAAAIDVRLVWGFVGIMLVMVGLIALTTTQQDPDWTLVGAVTVLFVPSLVLVIRVIMSMYSEHEHVDPEVAAILVAEGVGDPDGVFTELVRDFRGPRSTAPAH